MSIERSDQMILVALFLSRCGQKDSSRPKPPPQLATSKWDRAYAMFYDALGAGRTLRSFHNSLKASRDQFDSHVESGRRGWRIDGQPKPLPDRDQAVLDKWGSVSESDLWQAVAPFADLEVARVPDIVLSDLEAAQGSDQEDVKLGREGQRKARVSLKAERSPRIRAEAIAFHGTVCQVCGFDFGATYPNWGEGFVEVHHLLPLSGAPAEGQLVNPATDLAVVCANCHRMIHRKAKRVFTLSDLRSMIDRRAVAEWALSLREGNP